MSWITQAVFSKGELTPKLNSRYDLEMFRAGLKECLNFTVLRHGGLRKRSGTRFVTQVKDSSKQTRVIPFVFNTEQAYVLELGDLYFRVIADGAQVIDSGSPVEVVTPWSAAQNFDVHHVQSADVIYAVSGTIQPQKISRTSPVAFSCANVSFTAAPASWTGSNWPARICFFQERLALAGTPANPQTFWISKSGDLENMTTGANADDALEFTILAGQVNSIQFLLEGEEIVIGTTGATRTLGPASTIDPFSSTNVRQRRQSTHGSSSVQPVQIGAVVLFVGFYGKVVREFRYNFDDNSYISPDISIASDHITRLKIVEWAYAEEPNSTVYMVLSNGELASLTYDREQGVSGFVRHQIAGGSADTFGFVESVCVIPDDEQDRVYIVVKRTIGGQTKRYIELLEDDFEDQDLEDAFFVDSGLTYSGAATGTVSGLDHLEGETVSLLADGAVLPDVTVSSGSITLPNNATAGKIQVGLKFDATATTLPAPLQSQQGSSVGGRKKAKRARIDVLRTNYLRVGDIRAQENMIDRSPSDPMGSPVPLQNKTFDVKFDSAWGDEGRMKIVSDKPVPATVLSVTPLFEGEP